MNHKQVRLYVLLASTVLITGFTPSMSMAQPSYRSDGLSSDGLSNGESSSSQSCSYSQNQEEESSHEGNQRISSEYHLNSREEEEGVEEGEIISSNLRSNSLQEESQEEQKEKYQKKKRKSPKASDADSEGEERSGSHRSRKEKQRNKERERIQQLEHQITQQQLEQQIARQQEIIEQQQETIWRLNERIDPLQYWSEQYQEQLNNAQQELSNWNSLGWIDTALRNSAEQQFVGDRDAMRFRHQQEWEALETRLAQEQEQQDPEDDNLSREEMDQGHNNLREELQQRQNEEWMRLPWHIERAYLEQRPGRLQQLIERQEQDQKRVTILARSVAEQKDLMDISNAVLQLLFQQAEEQNTLRARHDRENSMVSLLEEASMANARGEQQRLATEALRHAHNAAQERLVQGFANRSRLLGAIVIFYLGQYITDIERLTTPLLTLPQTLAQRVHQQHLQIQAQQQQLGMQIHTQQENLQRIEGQIQEKQYTLEQTETMPTQNEPKIKSPQPLLSPNNQNPNHKGGPGGFGGLDSMVKSFFGGSRGQL